MQVEAPALIQEKADCLDKEIAPISAEIETIRAEIARSVNVETIANLTARIDELSERGSTLRCQHSALPLLTDSYISAFDTFERRRITEDLLIGALASNEIQCWALRGSNGIGIHSHLWCGARGFAYYLDLSLVVLPRYDYGKRRGTAKIRQTDFNTWLKSVSPLTEEAAAVLSTEEKAAAWFLREVATNRNKPPRRDDSLSEMQNHFPDLSMRAARRVWEKNAPGVWKKAGRRHGS